MDKVNKRFNLLEWVRFRPFFFHTVVIYLLGIVTFCTWQYLSSRDQMLREIDERLFLAASVVPHILPDGFSDRAIDSNSISKDEHIANMMALTNFAKDGNFKYIYTAIEHNNTIYLTSTSASKTELSKQDLLPYFTKYPEFDSLYKQVIKDSTPVYTSYSDRWGNYRSVLIPYRTPGQHVYVAGVDYDLSYVNKKVHSNLIRSLFLTLFLTTLSSLVFVAYLRTQRKTLKELKRLNTQLELDITVKQQLEADQLKLHETIRQNEKLEALGQLAGGIAHDFNNQLSGIMMCGDMLRTNRKDDCFDFELADMIVKTAQTSAQLTQQLLAFARKGKFQVTVVDINQVVAEVTVIMHRTFDKRINIHEHLSAPVPFVNGDQSQLQNSLLNICINARDSMPDGGDITISSETKTLDDAFCKASGFSITTGDYIELKIADTGIGMHEETLKHVFEPFFTTKEKGKGTGLGLASVYGTIKNHSGAVIVNSVPKNGTVVSIYLPLQKDFKQDKSIKAVKKPSMIKPINILLIEDEDTVAFAARQILLMDGHKVIRAVDGLHALSIYQENYNEIDVVILDLVMPRCSGKDTFTGLQKINPQVKIIIASGYSVEGEAQSLLDKGAKAFIQKPFSIYELRDSLRLAGSTLSVGENTNM